MTEAALDGDTGFARGSATETVVPLHAIESPVPLLAADEKKGALGGNMVSPELDETVERLVAGWLDNRNENESFPTFCDRTSDDELGAFAGREPARGREKEAA